MKRYFSTTLARRPMTLSGHVITFLIASISGGRAYGVYATENPEEIKVLDAAVAGRRGVSSISEGDYDVALKKASPIHSSLNSNGSPPRLALPKITPELAVNAKAGVAVGKPPAQETQFQGDTHTTPSIASLLRVKRLSPPTPFAASDAKVKKASARADRAKVRVARTSVATA